MFRLDGFQNVYVMYVGIASSLMSKSANDSERINQFALT